jgi:cytokinin dehydrogenase
MNNNLSRRSFAKALGIGTLVVGYRSITGSWITSAEAASQFEKLPPLDGELLLDETTRAEYAQDYGQIVHEKPIAVLKPKSVEDISRMIRFARRHGIRIAARGQGHLPFGQAQVRAGLVIDLRSLRTVHAISSDRLEADAGIQWRGLIKAALTGGLTPPVLTSFLGLTVGGTLSIGGIGTTSYRDGAQVDNVIELEVVTGEGAVLTCSEMQNRDLFEAVLAGQGQCAIITKAVVRLVPALSTVREYVLRYPDLKTLMHDATLLSSDQSGDGRFDGVVAWLIPLPGGDWGYFLISTRNFTPPDAPDDERLLAGLGYFPGAEQVNDYGYLEYVDSIPDLVFNKSRPDLTLLTPSPGASRFISEMLPRLTNDNLGTTDIIQLFFWPRTPFTRPLFRIPNREQVVGLAMLRTPTTDPEVIARMLAGNRTLFEENRSLGGTHYPFSALHLSRHDWQNHYGHLWDNLVRAKRRYDPDNAFASGPDIFHRQETHTY